jgi:hypothetical protein
VCITGLGMSAIAAKSVSPMKDEEEPRVVSCFRSGSKLFDRPTMGPWLGCRGPARVLLGAAFAIIVRDDSICLQVLFTSMNRNMLEVELKTKDIEATFR